MNFRQMQDVVLTMAHRRNEASEREVVKQHINDAYAELANRTRLLRASANVTITSSKSDYSLATDFGLTGISQIRRVSYTGTQSYGTIDLIPVDLSDMLDRRSVQSTGNWTRAFYLAGDDTFMVDPPPSVGEQMTFYFVAKPFDLDLDSDEPLSIPDEYHRVITYGAIRDAAKDAPVRLEYDARFEKGVGMVRNWVTTLGGDEPSLIEIGHRRRRPHDPSYYGGGYA